MVATNRLSHAYLQSLSLYNYIATVLATLIVIVSFYWLFFHIGGDKTATLFSNVVYFTVPCVSSLWAFQTAYLMRYGALRLTTRYQLVWLLIGFGLLMNGIAGIIYGYQFTTNGHEIFPSYADIFSNLYYPFVFLGLLLLPSTARFRMSMVLDALVTTLCILGVIWFFILGPAYFAHLQDGISFQKILALGTALSYPFGDIFLILALVLLIQRGVDPPLRVSFLLIGLSFLTNICGDSAYAYAKLITKDYQTGLSYIDVFWFASFLLLGLAALYQYSALARRAYSEQTIAGQMVAYPVGSDLKHSHTPIKRWWRLQNMSIYAPLTLLLGLTIFGEMLNDNRVSDSLALLTALTGGVVAVRHFFSIRENETLLQEREHLHLESEHLHRIIAQLSEILDLDRLRKHVTRLTLSELGFSSVMLLLLEEHGQSLNWQPHLLVNAATTPNSTNSWRFQGENLLYRMALEEQVVEVHWSEFASALPDEMQPWQKEQTASTMLFFPLIYQKRVLGSLGVARHATPHLSDHDISVVKAYAEQIAIVIEHAYLYEAAHERGNFAQSLANIATRLNAAVVGPVEISQLICEEAANALRADYAFLYIADEHGHLRPLAASIGDNEPASMLHEWPHFHISDYEALALHSLQPVLMPVTPLQKTDQKIHKIIMDGDSLIETSARITDNTLVPTSAFRRQQAFLLRAKLAQHCIQTAILAPLVTGGSIMGILLIARSVPPGTRDKHSFDASDLSHAQDFVEQAGVAFTNAQLYQHIRTAHQQLQELDQLKDQFMVTASHELRTPLTAIQGYIELMVQYNDILPTEQRSEFLQKAQRGCEELVLLLGNVMDASRLEVETADINPSLLKRVSVQEIIEKVIMLIEPQLAQEQRQAYVHVPAPLFIQADPVRLRQVLMNVSVNALKYSPPHTPLSFSAQMASDHSPYVVISISDKGTGIAAEDRERIFQRFFRLERDMNSPVRGSGLGLYISRRLIEAMSGKIWVESKGIPGEGSTFHIQLLMA